MHLLKSLIGLIILALLLVACGGEDPTPEPTATAEAVADTPVPTDVPEEIPTETPEPTATSEPVDEQPDESGGSDPASSEPASSRFPAAEIVNNEGGPVSITGEVTYSNPFFTLGVAEPVVILEDQAGFVDRDENFLMPLASQTLGQITSDFFTSPFEYSVALPIEPQGTLRDVDNDGEENEGVQVFAIAYWTNTFGDPFLEERDLSGGGWSTAYASTEVSDDASTEREIVGGSFLIYAPDGEQGFPSSFGEDGLLFTEDDPIVQVPAGYTVVNMDSDPFTFDRSSDPVIDLIEPESTALVDYSDMSYSEAFEAFVEQLKKEYAFTENKGIDWDALLEEFLPRFEAAEASDSNIAYRRALRDFSWRIPDGHISGPSVQEDFIEAVSGGLGFAINDVEDGRIIVSFLVPGGQAEEAGVELGAELLTLGDLGTEEAVEQAVVYSGPFSTTELERLWQLRYATRFPIDTEVDISWRNPGSESIQTATLTAVSEPESFNHSSFTPPRDGFEQPVEYEFLEDEGFGYAQIFSFADNELLSIQLWERLMQTLNEQGVPGLIVDMRRNGGGSGFLADQMAAYFFQEPLILGNTGRYDEDIDDFFFDTRSEERFYLPPEELRYDGEVVLIVGPNCASACEFFSYDMTLQDRATVVGHFATAGLGGSIERVAMPDGESFTFTQGRAVDADGNIHIEGIGVVPSVRVPVTEATLFSDGDPLLDAAIETMREAVFGAITEVGPIALGEEVSGELEPGERLRYELSLSEGDAFTLALESDDFEPVLGLYEAESGSFLGDSSGQPEAVFEELQTRSDLVLSLEVSAVGDGGGAFVLRVEDLN
jgi:C-terminal processing protease CtpA/Prc